MKPRTRWLRHFTSWFFNASPEWVPPQDRARAAGASGETADGHPGAKSGEKSEDKSEERPDEKPNA